MRSCPQLQCHSHWADSSPHSTQCINNWHRRHGYTSSLELPDNTLNFIKKHPLMEEQVGPRWGRPLLVKKDTNFTHLVADRVTGLDGATYTVLFIGTGGHVGTAAGGWVKACVPRAGRSGNAPGSWRPPIYICLAPPPQAMAGCSRP